jgi:uncharacterized membrane protein
MSVVDVLLWIAAIIVVLIGGVQKKSLPIVGAALGMAAFALPTIVAAFN